MMRTTLPASVVHLELHTPDVPNAEGFYAALCGWREEPVHTSAGTYVALELGEHLGGGLVPSPVARPLWLPYVQVEDIAGAVQRAQVLGARVLLAPRECPTGWRAAVATRAAGEIAFWQPKQ
jgi:predicted enzyme related to lactoylglutathione lyase